MTQDILQAFALAAREPARLADVAPQFRFAKVKPTDDCNSRCITCSYWETRHEGELSLTEVCDALAQLRGVGVTDVMFSGGEPTLRKDLPEMIAEAKRLGFSGISMTTNCLALGEGKLDQLLEAGLGELVLSFEGESTHDAIRGVPGNAAKVHRVLEALVARRDGGTYPNLSIKLATTLMSRTLDEVLGVLDLCRRHKVSVFFNLIDNGTYFFQGISESLFAIADLEAYDRLVDRLVAAKRAEPGLIGNSFSSLEYARRYFRDPKQADIPCYLGYVGLEVDANGDIYSNCWGLPKMGNIRKTRLADIVGGKVYRQRCRDMYAKRCRGCSCGYILNLAYHPTSRDFDRAQGGTGNLTYAGERT
ncbi:MAG: radical SAM protein [Magnetospirillum sp. WYHS-4]